MVLHSSPFFESWWARVLAIQEKVTGPKHPVFATTLRNLATLHHQRGAYDLAEQLHLRALNVRRECLGLQHPDVAESLDDLGDDSWRAPVEIVESAGTWMWFTVPNTRDGSEEIALAFQKRARR